MPRIIASLGLTLTVLSLLVLPWAHYGQEDFALYHFTGWPVHAASAVALQAIVAWALFRPARWPRARLIAGLACAVTAAASAIVLGSRYDNASDFFPEMVPLVMPHAGPGPFAAVLAAVIGAVSLLQAHAAHRRRTRPLPADARA